MRFSLSDQSRCMDFIAAICLPRFPRRKRGKCAPRCSTLAACASNVSFHIITPARRVSGMNRPQMNGWCWYVARRRSNSPMAIRGHSRRATGCCFRRTAATASRTPQRKPSGWRCIWQNSELPPRCDVDCSTNPSPGCDSANRTTSRFPPGEDDFPRICQSGTGVFEAHFHDRTYPAERLAGR